MWAARILPFIGKQAAADAAPCIAPPLFLEKLNGCQFIGAGNRNLANYIRLRQIVSFFHGWPNDMIAPWKTTVNAWLQETQSLLKSYSAQAEVAFLHDPHIVTPNYRLSAREYHQLVTRLNNLRGIMEKPEVYF